MRTGNPRYIRDSSDRRGISLNRLYLLLILNLFPDCQAQHESNRTKSS